MHYIEKEETISTFKEESKNQGRVRENGANTFILEILIFSGETAFFWWGFNPLRSQSGGPRQRIRGWIKEFNYNLMRENVVRHRSFHKIDA